MSEPKNDGNNNDTKKHNNKANNDTKNKNLVKVYLYNKVNVNGQDDSGYIREEIQSLIDNISKHKDAMCERRKDVGVGFLFGGNVYGEMKLIELLNDVFESYILGKYYAAVAVASMAAERLCYDFVNNLDITFGKKILTTEEKEQLMFIPYSRLIKFLKNIGIFSDDDFKLLDEINKIRNRHVHPKMKNVKLDATRIVKLLCKILENKLSMFNFYKIVNGRFVLNDSEESKQENKT